MMLCSCSLTNDQSLRCIWAICRDLHCSAEGLNEGNAGGAITLSIQAIQMSTAGLRREGGGSLKPGHCQVSAARGHHAFVPARCRT